MEKLNKSTLIEDVDISIRCYQILKRLNILDVKDLSQYTKAGFMAYGFVGKRTVVEVEELMYELGIKWKDNAR